MGHSTCAPVVILLAPETVSGVWEGAGSQESGVCWSQHYSHVVIDTAGGCGMSPGPLQAVLEGLCGSTVTLLTGNEQQGWIWGWVDGVIG